MSSAKEDFERLGGGEETDPLERLRFFCSLAMDGQDWIDVEAFLDDVAESAVQRPDGATLSDLLEAKPCPFCGGESITIQEGSTFRWMMVECNECGAASGEVRVQTIGEGPPAAWKAKGAQDAVAEWNKRAD